MNIVINSNTIDANGRQYSQEGLESLIQQTPLFFKIEDSEDVIEIKKMWVENNKVMADCEYHSDSDVWQKQMLRRTERSNVSMSIRSLAEKNANGSFTINKAVDILKTDLIQNKES